MPLRPARGDGEITRPLRLAAVGCGRVFERFHLPALRRSSDWTLVAAVDESADRLRWIGRLAPELPVAGSLAELDPLEVDAVLISSPPDTHCALAAEALRRGAHVIVEKPMAITPPESESLLALAGAAGRQVLVGFNRRFRPSYARLRDRLRRLPPPQIRGITCELGTDPARWQAVSRRGGVLDDLASHQLDLVPWIVDRPVEHVRATLERRPGGGATATIELRFAGGLLGRCRATHGSGSAEWVELVLADRVLMATIGGVALARPATAGLAQRYLTLRTLGSAALRRLTGAPAFTTETFTRQLAAWAATLRGSASELCADGRAGSRCVALVEACRQSAAVGGAWVAAGSR